VLSVHLDNSGLPVISCIATVILGDRLQLRLQTVRLPIFDSDPIQKHGFTIPGSMADRMWEAAADGAALDRILSHLKGWLRFGTWSRAATSMHLAD